jgi:hypothetical protein
MATKAAACDQQGHGQDQLLGVEFAQTAAASTWNILNRGFVYLRCPSSGGYLHLIWLPGAARELVHREGASQTSGDGIAASTR